METLCRRRRAWFSDETADPLIMFAQTNRIAREGHHFLRLARRHGFAAKTLPTAMLHADYRTGRSSIFTLHRRPRDELSDEPLLAQGTGSCQQTSQQPNPANGIGSDGISTGNGPQPAAVVDVAL